jgi:hypothetical protein
MEAAARWAWAVAAAGLAVFVAVLATAGPSLAAGRSGGAAITILTTVPTTSPPRSTVPATTVPSPVTTHPAATSTTRPGTPFTPPPATVPPPYYRTVAPTFRTGSTTSTSSTTSTTLAGIGGRVPAEQATVPLPTHGTNGHVNPVYAMLSGAGFFAALVIMAGRFFYTRRGGSDRMPLG